MSRFSRICLALLAGVSLIWLVQVAAAAVPSVPGLGTALRWVRENNFPIEIITSGVFSCLPVFGASVLVGLICFRLPERRGILFLCAAAPFVLYSLWMNIGMLVAAGNSLEIAVMESHVWLVVVAAATGLFCALVATSVLGAGVKTAVHTGGT